MSCSILSVLNVCRCPSTFPIRSQLQVSTCMTTTSPYHDTHTRGLSWSFVVHLMETLAVYAIVTSRAPEGASFANTHRTITANTVSFAFAWQVFKFMASHLGHCRWHDCHSRILGGTKTLHDRAHVVMARLALLSICVGLVQLVAVEQRHVDQVEEQFFPISLGGALGGNMVNFPVTDINASHILVVWGNALWLVFEDASACTHFNHACCWGCTEHQHRLPLRLFLAKRDKQNAVTTIAYHLTNVHFGWQ